MSTYVEGETTARGWRARKFYLSDAAIALLVAHCTGPRTMSSFLDDMIKRELDSPAMRFSRGEDLNARKQHVAGEFTTQDGTVLPTATEAIERHKDVMTKARSAQAQAQRVKDAAPYALPPRASQLMRDKTDDYERRIDEKKQPTKKDFKLDDI